MAATSVKEVLLHAQELRGRKIAELAALAKLNLEHSNTALKGKIGTLCELLLGATASSKPLPDFPELNLELKTIPVTQDYKVLESTFVTTFNLHSPGQWQQSSVYCKTRNILWIPIISSHENLQNAKIGKAFIWSPNAAEDSLLRQDWEELDFYLRLGQLQKITAEFGQALQLRPKGANKLAVASGVSEEGEQTASLMRAFYLRRNFTQQIIEHKIC